MTIYKGYTIVDDDYYLDKLNLITGNNKFMSSCANFGVQSAG